MKNEGKALATAEQYLDEMLSAEESLNYEQFVARFEPQSIVNFGESRFKKDMYAIREDLGNYRSRVYLGCLKGFDNADYPARHPGSMRYVWRGVFEKNETLVVVGIHEKDSIFLVNEFTYRH